MEAIILIVKGIICVCLGIAFICGFYFLANKKFDYFSITIITLLFAVGAFEIAMGCSL